MTEAGRKILRDRRALFGASVVCLLTAVAVLAPWLIQYDPAEILGQAFQQQPPSAAHPFGTDHVGRDVLSRVLAGIRLSLSIASLSVLLSLTIGTGVGMLAGYIGGIVDTLLMRIVDAALAVPRVLLLLVVLTLLPSGVVGLVVVLGLTSWFETSRVVRAEVLSLRERDFVVATSALGLRRHRILLRHLLPNVAAPVIVAATLGLGHIILIEAGLSYLGAGVPPPTASLGGIISDGMSNLAQAWWISAFPGLVIVLIVIGFSLIGDSLRDAMDPKSI
jgi:ABC-type dipeptide/oligopeptide/nickel transport system permease subunit